MATINLSEVTIPTPAAYDSEDPFKQQENLAYVKLQILTLLKTAGGKVADSNDLVEAVNALQNNEQKIDLQGQRITWSSRAFFYDHL